MIHSGRQVASAVVVTDTDGVCGDERICRVDTAAIVLHRESSPDFIEPIGEYPELLALVVAAKEARARNLPVVSPWGTIMPEHLNRDADA